MYMFTGDLIKDQRSNWKVRFRDHRRLAADVITVYCTAPMALLTMYRILNIMLIALNTLECKHSYWFPGGTPVHS